MGKLKQLASQTAIYGLSSIIGRLLNYLLVPLYTRVFVPGEYGIITELYTYVTFLMIFLTYGMETGFFYFSKNENNPDKVFSTAATSLFSTSCLFVLLGLLFAPEIAAMLNYENHVNYISFFVIILGLDAFTSIPFARLRQQNKALKFGVFKLINIAVNIGLNLFFILGLRKTGGYDADFGVGYVFLSNLIASGLTLLLFVPDFFKVKFAFDFTLLKRMLVYSLPLVVSGLAGMINEFFDRVSIKFFYTIPDSVTDANNYILSELGIYGANAKIAVLMTLFIQCFRYSADPFFFSNKGSKDFNELFAKVNKYLLTFGCLIFLGIMFYLDIIKHFIRDTYWDGLKVVPYLLIGHLLVGMVYLQSFWYKLNSKTVYGIYIFLIGSVVTVALNYIFVPKFGYTACAVANVVCYLIMLIITFLWGQKYLPCKYDFKSILLYTGLTAGLYAVSLWTESMIVNTVLLIIFTGIVVKNEKLWQYVNRKFLRRN
jgi:O-antigen/teichoic acid export membrane protein